LLRTEAPGRLASGNLPTAFGWTPEPAARVGGEGARGSVAFTKGEKVAGKCSENATGWCPPVVFVG